MGYSLLKGAAQLLRLSFMIKTSFKIFPLKDFILQSTPSAEQVTSTISHKQVLMLNRNPWRRLLIVH